MITNQTGWLAIVSILLTVALPVVVALATKASWPGSVKAVILLALVAAKSVGDAAVAGQISKAVVVTVVLNFVIAVAAHFGLWNAALPGGGSVSSKALDTGPIHD